MSANNLGAAALGKVAARTAAHVREFGAQGDGSTNDTAAFNAAIAWANTQSIALGGVQVTIGCAHGVYAVGQITLLDNVRLYGGGDARQGTQKAAKFLNSYLSAGQYMFSQASAVRDVVLEGLYAKGTGVNDQTGGVYLPNATEARIIGCDFDQWGLEAIVLGGGNCRIEACFTAGLFNTGLLATQKGAFTLSGGDHQVRQSEFSGPSQNAVSSADLYAAAAMFSQYDGLVEGCVFQTADIGLVAGSTRTRYMGCRFDTNAGHGIALTGIRNTFVGASFARNSFSANGTYDDINVGSSGGSQNNFVAANFWNNGAANARYRINDALPTSTFSNTYSSLAGEAGVSGFANITGVSSVIVPATTYPAALPTGATPSVLLGANFVTNNTAGATLVTNLQGGVPGQRITLLNGDGGNTTLQNGNNIVTLTGLNLTINATPVELIFQAGKWRQVVGPPATSTSICSPPVEDLLDLNYQAGVYGSSAGQTFATPNIVPGYTSLNSGNAASIPWAPTGNYLITVQATTPSAASFQYLFSLDDTTTNNRLGFYFGTFGGNPSLVPEAFVNGVSNSSGAYTIAANTAFKLAVIVTPDHYTYSVNGSAATRSNIGGSIPATRFLLGYKYNQSNPWGALPSRFRVTGLLTALADSVLPSLSV